MEDMGSAFTGQSAEPAAAQGQWDDWLQRPGNRTAMLQMGLQLMQPVGIGQTAGGHIAQSVGAGGEAVARQEAGDLKDRMAEAKMGAADERLRIAQQAADANTSRANTAAIRSTQKKVGGLTDLFKARAARQDADKFEKSLDKDAATLYDEATDLMNPDSPSAKKYKGMSKIDIRETLRKERPKPKFGAVPSNADDGSDDGENDSQQAPESNIPPGFTMYSDGIARKPDPNTPGKFLVLRNRS